MGSGPAYMLVSILFTNVGWYVHLSRVLWHTIENTAIFVSEPPIERIEIRSHQPNQTQQIQTQVIRI